MDKKTLIFYDATCVLCNRSIFWLIKNDSEDSFRFSHINSSFAKQQAFIISQEAISVLTPENVYLKSGKAALYLLLKTRRFKFLYLFLSKIPQGILDIFYAKIAVNRYRWFGSYSNCKIPDEKIKFKFLDF
ncbi:MAG: putative DCC family thiol-disulfide oxidoreductase YuxK [Flavobacteriaceae bacterium]